MRTCVAKLDSDRPIMWLHISCKPHKQCIQVQISRAVINPLHPNSDYHLTSHYHITSSSSIQEMRIKEMIQILPSCNIQNK